MIEARWVAAFTLFLTLTRARRPLMARQWSARCYGVARQREGSRQNSIGGPRASQAIFPGSRNGHANTLPIEVALPIGISLIIHPLLCKSNIQYISFWG